MNAMDEKPRSRFLRWGKYLIAAFVVGLVYAWITYPERFWLIVGVLAGILIVAGWIAEFLLPFVELKK